MVIVQRRTASRLVWIGDYWTRDVCHVPTTWRGRFGHFQVTVVPDRCTADSEARPWVQSIGEAVR